MVNMTAPERGDQNGSVEELFHPRTLFGNGAEAVFAFAVDKIGDGVVRRFSLVDPDAEFLLEHDVLADGTQSDALAFRFQMEGVAGTELQAVAKGLGQDDAAGFIEGKLGSHNGIMVWEKPVVNGISSNREPKIENGNSKMGLNPPRYGQQGRDSNYALAPAPLENDWIAATSSFWMSNTLSSLVVFNRSRTWLDGFSSLRSPP